jgi:hypothetical protein
MPCEWKGNIANDLRTNLFVVAMGNGCEQNNMSHTCLLKGQLLKLYY